MGVYNLRDFYEISIVCICEEGGVWDGIGSFEMNLIAVVLLFSELILLQYQNIKLSIQAVLELIHKILSLNMD